MKYKVNMIYKDDKSLSVMVKKEEIENFFNHLNASRVYIEPDQDIGFWTDISSIRYITVKEEEDVCIEVVARAESSDERPSPESETANKERKQDKKSER